MNKGDRLEFLERVKASIKYVKRRHTQNCDCLRKTHGDYGTTFYNIWKSLKNRCNNKNDILYGGRGIAYDPKWEKYEEFKKDMKLKYLYAQIVLKIKKVSIERKNVNGNYTKENCTFIDLKDQQNNTRKNKWFKAYSPDGKVYLNKNKALFARNHKLCDKCISSCLKYPDLYKQHKGWRFGYLFKKDKIKE